MTSYYTLTPTPNAPYQFSPTLDGSVYNVIVPFLGAGQRYYLNVYALSGALVAAVPVVASPVALNVETVSWDENTNSVIVTAVAPHDYVIGSVLSLTVSGFSPVAYNGTFLCRVVDALTLKYDLPSFPGSATTIGVVGQQINLVAGYFDSSTIVFREGMNYFEVSP